MERILEYTRDVPQEAAAIVQGRRPAPTWPEAGAISVENLTVQYPNTEAPVIRGMTFEVAPRTRVGIVGRTGAGKSSLTAALFRLVEPSPGSVVTIDGVDALSLGLEDLRSRLAIVPQVWQGRGGGSGLRRGRGDVLISCLTLSTRPLTAPPFRDGAALGGEGMLMSYIDVVV